MAKKYIDADRLKAEIEKHIKEVKDAAGKFTPDMGLFDAKLSGIYDVMAIIDFLTSEQPSEDLEEEINRYLQEVDRECDDDPTPYEVARHAAQWQKEQMEEQARKELAKTDITLADLVAFDEGEEGRQSR